MNLETRRAGTGIESRNHEFRKSQMPVRLGLLGFLASWL